MRQSEARNRAILNVIPDRMFMTTAEGVYVDYHAKDVSQLYMPPSAFIGKNIKDVIPAPGTRYCSKPLRVRGRRKSPK